jgi:hypothetical protein
MSAAAAPPVTLALELRRGVVFADEAHRQEASSWIQLVLDPRAKGGLLTVLNNEVRAMCAGKMTKRAARLMLKLPGRI